MTEEQIAIIYESMKYEESDDEEDDAIWPDNWDTCRVFFAMSTQWETEIAPNGRFLRKRLIYESLGSVSKALNLTVDENLLISLQVMEIAALEAFNE